MSVHLVGGGRDLEQATAVYGSFVDEAHVRARSAGRSVPRVGIVLIAEAEDLDAGVAWFAEALSRCQPVDVVARVHGSDGTGGSGGTAGTGGSGGAEGDDRGSVPWSTWWEGLDAVLVGGGLTPAYHRLLQPHAGMVRQAVASGLPYAGFSAGAMIAAQRALLGGWRIGELAVTHEDNAEDLDQVTVVDGLGLVAPTVEVHTAQWGTLSRLVAAVSDGLVPAGVALDENTVLTMDPAADTGSPVAPAAPGQVAGAGRVWWVERAEGAAAVTCRPARRG